MKVSTLLLKMLSVLFALCIPVIMATGAWLEENVVPTDTYLGTVGFFVVLFGTVVAVAIAVALTVALWQVSE